MSKGVVEQLCRVLGVATRCEPTREPYLVPGQTASLLAGDGTTIGVLGQVLPSVADGRGLPRQDRVFVAEVNLDRLSALPVAAGDATRPLPRHPFVVRDLSIVVADTLPAEIIRGTIQSAGGTTPAPLVGVNIFDRYQGKGIAGRLGEPVGEDDVPGTGSNAHRRGRAGERRNDSGHARARARGCSAMTFVKEVGVVMLG